jgi:hypothetical protein
MRKIFILALITILSINLFAQSSDDSNFRLGIGAAYVSEVESTSLSIKGIYEITEKWEVALAYSHVFENVGLSWDIIDLDGHFVFYDNDKKISAYALAGFALNFWRRQTLLTKETNTGSYMGMNIGAGMNIGMGEHFNLAPEIRGTIFDLSYTRIGITFQYMF